MRSDTKIIFEMFDTDSKNSSVPSCSQSQTDVLSLAEEKTDTELYATTEPNGFLLDGSYRILSELPTGLYSNQLSGKDGKFATPVVLEIRFTSPVTSSGITLYFPRNEYPSKLNVKWLSGENTLKTADFYPDSQAYFCKGEDGIYNRLILTFYGTSKPQHWIKLCGIDYGQTIQFEKDRIVKATVNQDVDILCDRISINTLEFSIEDTGKQFGTVGDNSIFFAVQESQKISVYTTISGKQEKVGVFFLKSLEGGGVTANFTAQDIIGVLEGEPEIKEGYYDMTFGAFCSLVLAGYRHTIDNRVASRNIKGYLTQCSRREALQQACFAVGAMVDTQGGEEIKIKSLPTVATQIFTDSDKFTGGKVENIKPYRFLSITAHNYDNDGIDTPTETVVELNPKAKGRIEIKDACFVNAENVQQVIARLTDYYNRKVLYKFRAPLNNLLIMGDMVMSRIDTSFVKGNITEMDTNLSGGLTAEITIKGYVFNITHSVYTGEFFTGEGGVI